MGSVYVDAAHLARLEFHARGLSFVAPPPVTSVLSGGHASRLRGRGLNFEEIRGYVPGDDVRHLDWKASLRLGKPLVRAYTEERDRPLLVVVDQRMSMFFGSRCAFKSVTAAEVAALAVWMGFAAGDRVGGIVFNDAEVAHVKPLRSRARIKQLFGTLARMNRTLSAASDARTDYRQLDAALESVLRLAGHDYLICVISDFAGAGERTRRLLRELSAHNDVVAAAIFDPAWEPLLQPVERRSPEHRALVVSEGRLQVELRFADARVRTPLSTLFSERMTEAAGLLRASGVPLMAVSTGEPCVDQVRRLFGERVRHRLRSGL
ncbi:MoxR protein [Burkholderia sp. SRS-W-2-2016]|uniref:DUF58 domain-containing protein n=1 Tax=Burkholderia sp. SRS-W-2-2016 TaxID=1926878 RepID=UPI00094ADE73|nr:MoxR protein [Burkholderia sp. SRS-W-2-2016]